MLRVRKLICIMMAVVMLAGCLGQKNTYAKEESAIDFVESLGSGWNLGNTLLCCNKQYLYGSTKNKERYYETLWGNPYTSKQMIDTVAEAGFKTVRIPVTYKNHIDSVSFKIDDAWLDRIQQLVDYVLDDGMYCIINVHHEDWLLADKDKQDYGAAGLSLIWQQVAARFINYDNRLIFEGFNEVVNSKKQWDWATAESYAVINYYNQVFVNSVRLVGGLNANRYLLVNSYAAKATESVLNGFKLPMDTINDRLIVSVHVYDNIKNIPKIMERLNTKFVSNGIPVIIGEWGQTSAGANTSALTSYAKAFVDCADIYDGIACVRWDDGGNMRIFNRKSCTWIDKNLVNAIAKN